MTWIKRNLYFLILCVVGLALMGGAGWYLYSEWKQNSDILDQLKEQFALLDTYSKENPHPGYKDGKVDNIKLAKEQQQQLRDFIGSTHKFFERIPSIPDGPKVSGQDFTTALHRTIDQLQHDAANSSVTLQANYLFSFAAENNKMDFAPGGLIPLARQLGEVKEICEVLFQAKINALDAIRRERVSADDVQAPGPDYVEERSTTNELAVLTPYEVTFKCFSTELAAALSGLGGSPHCLVVKTISVTRATAAAEAAPVVPSAPYIPPPPPPAPRPYGNPDVDGGGERMRQYGQNTYNTYGQNTYGQRPYGQTPYGQPPPTYAPAAAAPAATAPAAAMRGGLPIVLREEQLVVTLTLDVVKLLPPPAAK